MRDKQNQIMHLLKQNDTHFTNIKPSNALTKDLKTEMSYLKHKSFEKHAPQEPFQETSMEFTWHQQKIPKKITTIVLRKYLKKEPIAKVTAIQEAQTQIKFMLHFSTKLVIQ